MPRSRDNGARMSDDVAARIQARILEGQLKPGDRLPPERSFALTLGISRSTLREAIQKLESQGHVTSRQGGGTYITADFDTLRVDPWLAALEGQAGLQDDVLDFREMLEVQAAAWAAERATAEDRTLLQGAFTTLDQAYAQDDRQWQISADVAFHQAIAECAHNLLLSHLNANLLRLLHEHIRRNISQMVISPPVAAQLMAQHRDLLEAILGADVPAAVNAARQHIAYVRDRTRHAERAGLWAEQTRRRLQP